MPIKRTLIFYFAVLGVIFYHSQAHAADVSSKKSQGIAIAYPKINDGSGNNKKLLMRGEYLRKMGDCAGCHTDKNNHAGVTPISHQAHSLHIIIFWICVAIGIVVFAVLLYSLIMHRKSRGHEARKFHEHPILELTWAIIPLIILVAMVVPAAKVLIRMEDYRNSEITLKLTGS